jgi:hypothetical protein
VQTYFILAFLWIYYLLFASSIDHGQQANQRPRQSHRTSITLFTYPLAGCLGFFDGKQPQNTCQIKKLWAKSRKPLNLRILDPFLTTPQKNFFFNDCPHQRGSFHALFFFEKTSKPKKHEKLPNGFVKRLMSSPAT